MRQLVLAADIGAHQTTLHRPHSRAQQRDIDDDALAGALPMKQRGRNSASQRQAGLYVAECGSRQRHQFGRALRRRCDANSTPQPIGQAVKPALLRFRPAHTMGGAARIDYPRIHSLNVRDVDAEFAARGRQKNW